MSAEDRLMVNALTTGFITGFVAATLVWLFWIPV